MVQELGPIYAFVSCGVDQTGYKAFVKKKGMKEICFIAETLCSLCS